jgi:hypothetical protein
MQSTNVFLPDEATGLPVAQKATTGGAALVADQALQPGASEQFVRSFGGAMGEIYATVAGVYTATPTGLETACILYGVACRVAGTITVYRAGAATAGTEIPGLNALAMTAGQRVLLWGGAGEKRNGPIWIVTSGASNQFEVLAAPGAAA